MIRALSALYRERTITRLIIEHPGQNLAQLAHLATMPEAQAAVTLAGLEARGVVERVGDGWQRRRSVVSFRRTT